jgi:mRNA-degrading endonuclease toxin of MazEF toxin-antitoxin module
MFKQGEIYWVYVIVSSNYVNNQGQKNVVGVPFSTRLHKANSHRILIPVIHMIRDAACTRQLTDSVALTDHIRVLDPNRFDPKWGASPTPPWAH